MVLATAFLLTNTAFAQGTNLVSVTEIFSTNLRVGDRGEDVQTLQKVLNSLPETKLGDTGPGAPGEETTYFGELTKGAVVKFQEKYAQEILFPIQLVQGTGFVGPMTREKLNEAAVSAGITANMQGTSGSGTLSGGATGITGSSQGSTGQTTAIKPKITSLSPTSGINGTEITIRGEGFTSTGNTIRTTFGLFENIPSGDRKTINFKFFSDVVEKQLGVEEMKQNGITATDILEELVAPLPTASTTVPVIVGVANKNGGSNFVQFDLDMDITHYLATSTVSTNTNGHPLLLQRVASFLSNFTIAKIAEAKKKGPSPAEIAKKLADSQWNQLTGSTGGGGSVGGAGPAFGGNVIMVIPCPCSAGVAFTIRPVAGSPGPYFAPYFSWKANYAIFPGNWVLGSAPLPGACLTVAFCYPYSAPLIPPTPGVGTSLGM